MDYSQGIAPYLALGAAGDTTADPIADFLAAQAGPGAQVLDIGSGIGNTGFALAARGLSVTALEPDREMYTVLASRLAAAPADLAARVTPLPLAAGCVLPRRYALVNCGSLLHLMKPDERAGLVRWAAAQLGPGGTLVLDVPVVAPTREPRDVWTIAEKDFGDLRVEHHARLERAAHEGRWITHWTFRARLGETTVAEIARRFDWQPLPLDEPARLVESCSLRVVDRFGGPDRSPFQPGSSRSMWLVSRRD